MILLTGVTGRVGQAAARTLLRNGEMVRGFARDPDKLKSGDLEGLEVIKGDLADRESIDKAMRGITRALLVTANSEQQFSLEKAFVDSAVATGVEHIVKISSMEAGPDARAPIPKLHYEAEELIKQQPLEWTMLQPNFYMQNLLMYAQGIAAADQFALPFGNAKVSLVDCADVGEVAAAVLCESGHGGKTYQLTGAGLTDFNEVAAILSRVCGRPIRYVDQSPEDFRAFLSQFVKSEWHVNAVCELFAEIKGGALETATDDVRTILGREPISLEAFATRYKLAFC